jgi:hypothetical protein
MRGSEPIERSNVEERLPNPLLGSYSRDRDEERRILRALYVFR